MLPHTLEYDQEQSQYWSTQQTELHPFCRFLPTNADDVRDALSAAWAQNASVAIASGGHSSNIGASNTENGLTIDLSRMNEVVLEHDHESVSIGPGARWSEVYEALEKHNLTVPGGRAGHIGVGGYVLGGGFSWHANDVGWSCDSVLEFEVVTPDLRILTASENDHEDLFWALKGSLGAFGIVTNIKMRTIKTPGFYGGAIAYAEEALPAVFATLKELARNSEMDPLTSGYVSYGYNASTKDTSYNAYLINSGLYKSSPTIGNFLRIPNRGHHFRRMTPSQSAEQIAASNPLGYRRSKFTLTTLPTMEVMDMAWHAFQGFVEDVKLDNTSMVGVTYQPLTVQHLRARDNIFSEALTPDYGPLLLISVELWWTDAAQDAYLENEFQVLWDMLVYALQWMLVLHAWVYPNYAASWKEPFGDYVLGPATMEGLRIVKESYDPHDVWRELVPGIWHV